MRKIILAVAIVCVAAGLLIWRHLHIAAIPSVPSDLPSVTLDDPFPGAPIGEVRRFAEPGDGKLMAVIFTPDGQAVIDGGRSDGTIHMTDLATGKQMRTFSGHSARVHALAISDDGRVLVSGGDDKTARVWNVSTSERIATIQRGREVSTVSISPDGRYCIVGDLGGAGDLYELPGGKKVDAFSSEGGYASAFSMSGRYAVTGGWDHISHVWDLRNSYRHVGDYRQAAQVYALGFTYDETRLISAGADRVAHVWDISSGRELFACPGQSKVITCLSVRRGDREFLTSSEDGTVRTWSLTDGKELHRFTAHEGGAYSIRTSPNGRLAASAGNDGTVAIWKLPAAN